MTATLFLLQQAMGQHVLDGAKQDRPIQAIAYDSKTVTAGTLFFCKGKNFKKEYLEEALQRGAVAYVAEEDFRVNADRILVDNMRHVLASCARLFYGNPQDSLRLFAITGTKGKTSTAWYLRTILNAYYEKRNLPPVGFLSSISMFDGKEEEPSTLTTPEPFELYALLARCVANGIQDVVMEVSSQALKYERTAGLHFALAAFLNISPDHVSPIEHPSFADYFQSKLSLFSQADEALINLESDHLDEIERAASSCRKIYHVGIKDQDHADMTATALPENEGIAFTLHANGKSVMLSLPEIGPYAMQNALVAAAMAQVAGVDLSEVPSALDGTHVPGRMDVLRSADGCITVIVDLAHNGVSFEAIFSAVKKQYPKHEVIAVFGSAGGKGLNRRQDLGRIADRYADRILLTMEDPNFEPLSAIYHDIQEAIVHTPLETVDDRGQAIARAMTYANEHVREGGKCVLLLLGKGNEPEMRIEGVAYPFEGDLSLVRPLLTAYDKTSAEDPNFPAL
ncbi:UDP-N-acetylmuramoyl-L-alanyl-D-glutamate--2,6-diaminopimelate ligase [Murdochiella sp. Marseille-P8839]|nr:UDP-N-acetylmuramoyl-L-alanyl-D-glutamate--2,6-diaminopimelate ligase [Murdochiella sp. Marseille-P8839]